MPVCSPATSPPRHGHGPAWQIDGCRCPQGDAEGDYARRSSTHRRPGAAPGRVRFSGSVTLGWAVWHLVVNACPQSPCASPSPSGQEAPHIFCLASSNLPPGPLRFYQEISLRPLPARQPGDFITYLSYDKPSPCQSGSLVGPRALPGGIQVLRQAYWGSSGLREEAISQERV